MVLYFVCRDSAGIADTAPQAFVRARYVQDFRVSQGDSATHKRTAPCILPPELSTDTSDRSLDAELITVGEF